MANMSYCRFENTYRDLRNCHDHITDPVSGTEREYRQLLVELCADLLRELNVDVPHGEIEIPEYDDEPEYED